MEYDFTRPSIDVQLALGKQGEQHVLHKMGAGKLRRLTLAIHEAGLDCLKQTAAERAEIVLYDEPDSHLDYSSQRELFGILEQQSALAHAQVLVATHSLNFIDRVPLQAIAHYRLDDSQHTELEVLSSREFHDEADFLASICTGLGLRNSVLLDERVFLMVEGNTEESALPDLFRTVAGQSLLSSGVTVFNSHGSGALRKIAEALKLDWGRELVALLDEDQRIKSGDWIAGLGLTEGVDLFFVGRKEFEDAITDDQWADILNAKFPPQDDSGDIWESREILAFRGADKFSDALLNRVRARCRNHRIRKPDLGLALGQELRSVDRIPQPLVDCIKTARRLTL